MMKPDYLASKDAPAAYPAKLVETWPARNSQRYKIELFSKDALAEQAAEYLKQKGQSMTYSQYIAVEAAFKELFGEPTTRA